MNAVHECRVHTHTQYIASFKTCRFIYYYDYKFINNFNNTFIFLHWHYDQRKNTQGPPYIFVYADDTCLMFTRFILVSMIGIISSDIIVIIYNIFRLCKRIICCAVDTRQPFFCPRVNNLHAFSRTPPRITMLGHATELRLVYYLSLLLLFTQFDEV